MQARSADNFRLDVPRAQALPSFLQTEYFPDNVLIIFAKLRTKNAINYWVGEAAWKWDDNEPEIKQTVCVIQMYFAQHEANAAW